MSKAKDIPNEFKTGDFEVDSAPNPTSVVMDHSKTLITISTAFMALLATFSEKLLADEPSTFDCWLFGSLWVFLLLGMFCGVVSAQWLHGFLLWPQAEAGQENNQRSTNCAHNISAAAGNFGPWFLFLAGIVAAWLSISKVSHGGRSLDANKSVKVSTTYLVTLLGLSPSQITFQKMQWNEAQKQFDVTMQAQETEFVMTVDAKRGAVLGAKRLQSVSMSDSPVKSPAAPIITVSNVILIPTITNLVQMPAISNFVQMPTITNLVQISTITNIVQIPPITNNFQTPPKAGSFRRWGFGIGAERQD